MKKFGFSLMEMMIVLLIVSIVMACSAPMVSQKLAKTEGESPWVFTNAAGSSAYNMSGNNTITSLIGTSILPNSDAVTNARQYIQANNAPQIGFGGNGNTSMGLTVKNNSVFLTSNDVKNNGANGAIAVGNNSTAGGQNSIAIGNGATANAMNSIAIGNGVTNSTANSVQLGTNSQDVIIPGNLIVKGVVKLENTLTVTGDSTFEADLTTQTFRTKGLAKLSGGVKMSLGAAPNKGTNDEGTKTGTLSYFNHGSANYKAIGMSYSDRRLKDVGEAFTAGLEEIKKLELFNYTYKKDENKTPQVGVIAQDLQKIFPNAVREGEDGFLRIRWDEMFYASINAIKELDKKIEAHVSDFLTLQKEVKELREEFEELKKENKELKEENKEFKKELKEIKKLLKKQ